MEWPNGQREFSNKKEKKRKGIAAPSRNKVLGIFKVRILRKINIFFFKGFALISGNKYLLRSLKINQRKEVTIWLSGFTAHCWDERLLVRILGSVIFVQLKKKIYIYIYIY